MVNISSPVKVAFVFCCGASPSDSLSGYRAASFRHGLAAAGIEPVLIDVSGGEADRASTRAELDVVACRLEELPGLLRKSAPDLIQTFGAVSDCTPVWSAAAQVGLPVLHYVQAEPFSDEPVQGRLARTLSALAPTFWADGDRRHVRGVLGSSRKVVSRFIDAGIFPAAGFSRVIAPLIELPAVTETETPSVAAPGVTFGVYDPYGSVETLTFIAQAVLLAGHANLFRVKIAHPAYQHPPSLPCNVSVVAPHDPTYFINSVDAVILGYDSDHLVPILLMALRAGKFVIAPDGGVASELLGFGRHGLMFAEGSAYDLGLKINIVHGSNKDRVFEFQGGGDVTLRCAPEEVAKAFAKSFHTALTSSTGD